MNKKRRSLLVLLLIMLLAVSLVFAGCATDSATTGEEKKDTNEPKTETQKTTDKPVLEFAHVWTGGDAKASLYEPAIENYVQENADTVDISVYAVAGHEFQDIMKVRMAANELPDLFLYWPGEGNLKPFVDADKLLEVDEFINNGDTTLTYDMFEASMFNSCKVEGVPYAIPLEQFKGFWIANKNLFDQYNLDIPETYEDLKAVSEVFVENGIVPINMGSKGGNPGHLMYNAFSYQYKNGFEDAESMPETYQFDLEANLKAAQIIDEMRQLNMFPEDTIANGDWGPAVNLYNQEKAAMVFCFPWKIGDVLPEIIEKSVFFNTPKLTDAVRDPATFTIGAQSMALLINKDSYSDPAKQEELIKFANYLISDEMYDLLAHTGNMPAKDVKITQDGLNPLFVKAIDVTASQSALPPMWNIIPDPEIHTTYIESLDLLYAGVITPEEFIDQVQQAFNDKK